MAAQSVANSQGHRDAGSPRGMQMVGRIKARKEAWKEPRGVEESLAGGVSLGQEL